MHDPVDSDAECCKWQRNTSCADRKLERPSAACKFGEEDCRLALVTSIMLVVASRNVRAEAACGIESIHGFTLSDFKHTTPWNFNDDQT